MPKPIIFLFLLFLQPCRGTAIPTDSARITLEGFKKTDPFIIFRNGLESEQYILPIILTGQKFKTIFTPSPMMFYSGDDRRKPFFLMPNDKMVIIKKGDDYAFRFERDPIRGNEQTLLWKIYKQFGPVYGSFSEESQSSLYGFIENKGSDRDVDSLSGLTKRNTRMRELFNKKSAFIDSYKKTNPISVYFENYLKKYLYYVYTEALVKGFKLYSKFTVDDIKFMVPIIKDEDQSDTSLLKMDRYTSFLNSYSKLLQDLSGCKLGLCRLQSIVINFDSSARNYLLFQDIKKQFDRPDSTLKKSIEYFNLHCSNQQYIHLVANEARLMNLLADSTSQDILCNLNMANSAFADFLAEKKDKIIIVDFWASWCMPCMKELTSYPKLISKYSSNDKVTFLFISMDKSFNNWKNASKKFSFMNEQNTFLLKNNFDASFALKYSIYSIPRTMVIGVGNVFFSKDAPAPDSKGMEMLIEGALKNQLPKEIDKSKENKLKQSKEIMKLSGD